MITTVHVTTAARRFAVAVCHTSRLAVATAVLAAAALVAMPASAQAEPACSQYDFDGEFALTQTNGDTVRFRANGPTVDSTAYATGGLNGPLVGRVSGRIAGRNVKFTITWSFISVGVYTGDVSFDGTVHGQTYEQSNPTNSAKWDSLVRLPCATPTTPPPAPATQPAPAPAPPPAGPAAAKLTINGTGPTTLRAGLSGTYTVNVANTGGADASAEVFINFFGTLDQTNQVLPSAGFNCEVRRGDAGVNATVRCTIPKLPPKAPASIVVQARGLKPGPGKLLATVNSDPGVGFDNKTQQLNVTIT